MEIRLNVTGMMCGHCESFVVKTLEKLDGVEHAEAFHEENLVKIRANKEIPEEILKNAIEEAGYNYKGLV